MEKEPVMSKYPEILQLYISDRCNYKCVFCINRQHSYASKNELECHDIDPEILERISDALEHSGCLYLTGGGEPMMSALFWEFVDGKRKSKSLYFNTNASLLNRRNIERLLSYEGQLNLGISLNAASRSTYSRLMGVDLYDRVVENIKSLSRMRAVASRQIQIDVSIVVVKENINELLEFCRIAGELGADRLVAHIAEFNAEYVMNWFDVREQSLRHNPELLKEFEDKIKMMEEECRRLGLILWSRDGSDELWDKTCDDIFSYMGITSKGDTFSCCKGCAVPTGNVMHYDSFMDLWNNEKRRKMRSTILAGGFPSECRKPICPYWRVRKKRSDDLLSHGETRYAEGKKNEAVSMFDEAIRMNPYNGMAYNNLGVVALERNDFREALRNFEKALRLSPDDREVNMNIVSLLCVMGMSKDACKLANDYMMRHPDDAEFATRVLELIKSEDRNTGVPAI